MLLRRLAVAAHGINVHAEMAVTQAQTAFYCAFVMFDTIENAQRAVEEHRYPRIKGGLMSRARPYNLHAIRGEPGGKDVQSTSIFVRGFESTKWTHEDLYVKFCQFGKILSCKVSVDAEH